MKHLWLTLLLAVSLSCAARQTDPAESIYHLEVRLTDQHGQARGLDVHRGHPVLISMFYGSCAASCPLVIEAVRSTERALSAAQRGEVRVLLVSIDPEQDTPERLQQLVTERHLDANRWTLAHADAAVVRQIAAVLNVQYRRLPNGQYNHSNVIAVLSSQGEILATSSLVGRTDPAILAALQTAESQH